MIEAPLYTNEGKKQGVVSLPSELFTLPWSPIVVSSVVRGLAANLRSGTAHTKQRAAVAGGGRKPWRQKGTGRARHGSIRSPLWVGGGVTFGPSKMKDYSITLNRKLRAKAFFIVLSEKCRLQALSFSEQFVFSQPSTKQARQFITEMCGESGDVPKRICSIVFASPNIVAQKSFANLPGVTTHSLQSFDTRDAFLSKHILFVGSEEALSHFSSRGAVLTRKRHATSSS